MTLNTFIQRRRTICIIGASRGIGHSLAMRFARPEIDLILFARDARRLESLASACRQRGAGVFASATDITDFNSFAAALHHGCRDATIDLAIVNAGVSKGISEPLFPIEVSLDIVKTNLIAAMHTVSLLVHQMRTRPPGHLVIMISLSAFLFTPGSHGYCASKAGLRAFAKSLRDPLDQSGIRLTEVYPGIVKTGMYEQMGIRSPFTISADRAAEKIESAINRNRRTVFVPLRHFILLWLFKGLIPMSWIRRVLVKSGAEIYAE